MKIKIMLDDKALVPTRAHKQDGGYDLLSPVKFTLGAKKSASIDTGVHIEIPEGYVGFIKSKSGLNVKHGIQSEGVIDSGYTGSMVAKLYNNSDEDYTFNRGDKITQLVILPIPQVELVREEFNQNTERGSKGFGSSGR